MWTLTPEGQGPSLVVTAVMSRDPLAGAMAFSIRTVPSGLARERSRGIPVGSRTEASVWPSRIADVPPGSYQRGWAGAE